MAIQSFGPPGAQEWIEPCAEAREKARELVKSDNFMFGKRGL